MHKTAIYLLGILTITFLFVSPVRAEISLPRLVSNGMVLQRDKEINVWGWADPEEAININFIDQEYAVRADTAGNWKIVIPPHKAGGPFTMQIEGDNKIELNDILIGDVWICSGQSNMEISLKRVEPLYPEEIVNAEYPEIRYFLVPKKYNFKAPQTDLPYGNWQKVEPEMAADMAAIPYFFAKELFQKYKVPIGLINASLGGSPIEAWMSEEALKPFTDHYQEAMRFRNDSLIEAIQAADRERFSQWYRESWENDSGYKNPDLPWYKPELDDSDWQMMDIPGYWADTDLGAINGVVWFRRKISVPESMTNKPVRLNIGRIIDADSVFVNGIFVGSTGYQYPPRRYDIPAGLLKVGENVIVVRVISNLGRGGFEPDKPYELVTENQRIEIKGEWKFKLGAEMAPLGPQTFIRWKPMGLYNAMIAPLLNYTPKGIIWYQGESNAGNPQEYADLFPAMIHDWRDKWEQSDLPFIYVQLPNFMKPVENPGESNWAEFRQVQFNSLEIKNTGMAVTIDIGEWNDIHPLNKKDIGKRLALAAQKVAYGEENIIFSGPIYKSMEIKDNNIILSFTSTGSGLVFKGDNERYEFAIAGEDSKFVRAEAKIVGDNVMVWSDEIDSPVAVRYAWADNPNGILLYNKEGLPASPFTTQR